MNKLRPSERWIRLLAFVFSILLYVAVVGVIWWGADRLSDEEATSIHVNAVNLSFAQMELVAVEEPPPPKEPEPLPPDLSRRNEMEEEEADIALEEIIEEPEPEPEPIQADAQVTQEASSADEEVTTDAVSDWVLTQIQTEKYYPPSAQRAGYEGVFDLLVIIEADGTISAATITYGKGHPLLRRSLEKMLGKLIGRNFGQPIGQAVEMPVEFEFELE